MPLNICVTLEKRLAPGVLADNEGRCATEKHWAGREDAVGRAACIYKVFPADVFLEARRVLPNNKEFRPLFRFRGLSGGSICEDAGPEMLRTPPDNGVEFGFMIGESSITDHVT